MTTTIEAHLNNKTKEKHDGDIKEKNIFTFEQKCDVNMGLIRISKIRQLQYVNKLC